MMWLRFVGISIVQWIAVLLVTSVVASAVQPLGLYGVWLAIPMWIISAFIAFGFALWALHTKFPSKRDVIGFIGIWILSTVCLQVFYELTTMNQLIFIVRDPFLYLTYVCEIAAMLYAVRCTRQRKLRNVAGEGVAI